jgi:thiamine biosynthesis lipoprotein
MATTFEFRVHHAGPVYARQAAQAAFAEIDRLETLLSRFHEGSDIWRINHAATGEHVVISEECHACLLQALRLHELTGGAFDVTIGAAADLVKSAGKNHALPAPDALQDLLDRRAASTIALSPDSFVVEITQPGASLDLGAIGKGFALDAAAALLREWEIENALLSAGGSSILAMGAESDAPGAPGTGGWTVNLLGETRSAPLVLHDCALGASGTGGQGSHIIDPRRRSQAYAHIRAWALAPAAAAADALSTAWMTMNRDEIAGVVAGLAPGHAAVVENPDGSLHRCNHTGLWARLEAGTWPARA